MIDSFEGNYNLASYRPPLDHPSGSSPSPFTNYELPPSFSQPPDDGPVLLETSTASLWGTSETSLTISVADHLPTSLRLHACAHSNSDPVPIPSHLPPTLDIFRDSVHNPTPSQTNTDTDLDTASRPRILHIPFRRIGIDHAVVRPGAAQ